jgi:pyruvate,orthophosphate dikinase
MSRDAILVALSIKGMANTDSVAAAAAETRDAVERELESFEAAALAERTKIGWRLTAEGRAAADAVIRAERVTLDQREVDAQYERFTELNDRFKAAIMAWQLRDVDGAPVPNDHSDTAYDADVLRRIAAIDRDLHDVVAWIGTHVGRTFAYRQRFALALEKAMRGERRFVAAPLIDSYHTVWFELHEELIRLSGRTRAEEAAAGRGA